MEPMQEQRPALSVLLAILVGLGAAIQFAVMNPIHQQFAAMNKRFDQRFGAINQRFNDMNQRLDDLKTDLGTRLDDQDKYINQRLDRLQSHVSELRGLSKRVSEDSIRIKAIERQLTTADAPSSAD